MGSCGSFTIVNVEAFNSVNVIIHTRVLSNGSDYGRASAGRCGGQRLGMTVCVSDPTIAVLATACGAEEPTLCNSHPWYTPNQRRIPKQTSFEIVRNCGWFVLL